MHTDVGSLVHSSHVRKVGGRGTKHTHQCPLVRLNKFSCWTGVHFVSPECFVVEHPLNERDRGACGGMERRVN